MLYITFKESNKTLRGVSSYFDYNYLDEWFDNEMVRAMILDVDKSIVRSSNCIESPVLGQIAPTGLSGGVKTLITMLMLSDEDFEFYATSCGDNCAKWIIEISKVKDVTIVLKHVMHFEEDFQAVCLDTNKKIETLSDYRRCVLDCL